MSTLSVSAIQNTASPVTNVVLNADGSSTVALYNAAVAPTPTQTGTLWYDASGIVTGDSTVLIWDGAAWVGTIGATAATLAEAAAGVVTTKYSSPETSVPKDTAGMAGAALLPSGGNYGGSTSGMFRFNTTSNHVEFYDGSAWQTSVNRSGDTMTGTLTTPAINYTNGTLAFKANITDSSPQPTVSATIGVSNTNFAGASASYVLIFGDGGIQSQAPGGVFQCNNGWAAANTEVFISSWNAAQGTGFERSSAVLGVQGGPAGTADFINCTDSSNVGLIRLVADGGIGNVQANNFNISDRREKKDITPCETTWDKVKNWDLKRFRYNSEDENTAPHYGVIAQELQEIHPELVTIFQREEAAKEAIYDGSGNLVQQATPAKEERLGVKEQQMFWVLAKAFQESQTKIEALEAELAALKAS